jgi:uncharacterized membrane protein
VPLWLAPKAGRLFYLGGPVRKLTRVLLIAAAVLLAAAGVAGLRAGPAAAKDYSIDDVTIDAKVLRNGDVRVHEQRTLTFSGTFHYVYWDYDTKGSEGIRVRGAGGPSGPYAEGPSSLVGSSMIVPDTYAVQEGLDTVRVQLDFELTDTDATFYVDYTAFGAAKRWKDTAELYWQFIGAGSAKPADRATITVHLPSGVTTSEVRAWTHGPLWGTVTIQPDASVVSEVSPLPAETFVESRILFPADALSDAAPSAAPRLQAVLDEEKGLADAANRSRLWARVKVFLWSVPGAGLPLLALILVLVLYFKYGREPKTRFKAEYLRDIPEPSLPPALVGFIWRMGNVAREDATATLLDLVNRGVIAIERVQVAEDGLFGAKDQTTYRLTLQEDQLGGLADFERDLVDLVFDTMVRSTSFLLSELKDEVKKRRATVASGYKSWTDKVQKEGERRGYLDTRADRMAFAGAAVSFIAIVGAGAAAVFSQFWWFLIGVVVGILLVSLSRAIKRRSQEAAELHAQYEALKRYMKDFGRMDEKPPDAVVLWEQFLVYAVVFDMADEVVKAMQVRIPEVVEDPAFGRMYWLMFPMYGPGGGGSPFSEMSQSFTQAVAVATSSSSSGSGGGGGFSGGGGGGGGGGGFGAG